MSSNINPYNIDGTFPVANQDNPSQGFRDNFTNIRNNFIYAASEISDLQSKAVLTSALNGQTISNDMAGTQLRRPQLAAWTQSLIDLGAVTGTAVLDFNQANFQKITTAGPITLSFINWPASTGAGALGYGLMRVWIYVTATSHYVTLPASVTIGINDLAGYDPVDSRIVFDQPGNYIFDFSSINGGTNYEVFDVARNRATFRDPSFYYDDAMGSNFYFNFQYGLPTAQHYLDSHNTITNLGPYDAWGVGNLSNVDIVSGNTIIYVDPSTGNNLLPAYTVTGARGNIQYYDTASLINNIDGLLEPVQPNDPLGMVNAMAFTGNGTGNAFNQVSAIAFYVTGANVTYGLGGNIAMFTGHDGDGDAGGLAQAVGVENDQSAHFFGNLVLTSSNVSIPATSSSTGVAGQIAWDTNYVYVCTATNTWKRIAYTSTTW